MLKTLMTTVLAYWRPRSAFGQKVKDLLPVGLVLGVVAASAVAAGAFEHVWDCCKIAQ